MCLGTQWGWLCDERQCSQEIEAETNPRRSDPRMRKIFAPTIVASLAMSQIVCIGTYSILCDFGADTSFYAYIGI